MSLELLHTGGCSSETAVQDEPAEAADSELEAFEEALRLDGEDELRLRRVMQRLRDHIESECDAPRPRDPSREHRAVSGEILTS